jgi:L-threonylcarbamoyladenylate synthase
MNPVVINWQDDNIQKIIFALQNNDLLITTTDTVPGFLANTTKQAFEKLNQIKQDRQNKPYIILISDAQKLDLFIDTNQITQQERNLFTHCWPGPLTIIFKAKANLPDFLKSAEDTVAIRCPDHTKLLETLKHFNGLFSTSANISSQPAPTKITDIDHQIASQVKYLVYNNTTSPMTSHTNASTIIDISSGHPHIIRHGAYSQQEIEQILLKK